MGDASPLPSPAPPPWAAITRTRLALRFTLGLCGVMLGFGALGLVIREPAERLGKTIASEWGLPGLFLAVMTAESSPIPLMGEPLLVLAYEGGLALAAVIVVGCAANVAASALSYLCGRALSGLGLVDRLLGARRAEAEALVREKGAWALVIASVTPIPFATIAWTCGGLRMPLLPYALASFVRIPKVLVTLMVVHTGWAAGR